METNYTIGYVDEDPQQVKRFRRNLRPYGFTVVGYEYEKNMSPESLMVQIYDSDIDLLMIDYKLKETNIVPFNGDVIGQMIYETKPLFPHIIFTSDTDQAEAHVEDLKIIYDKGEVFADDKDYNDDDEKEGEKQAHLERFVKMLKGSINQYRSYVGKKKNALTALLEKGEKEGLSASEKNEILTLQTDLQNLDKSKVHEIPKQLITNENLEELAKTRKEAEAFLANLIEKSK